MHLLFLASKSKLQVLNTYLTMLPEPFRVHFYRYLNETKELDISLDTVWRGHEGQLHQVLLLRRFEMDFKELQVNYGFVLKHRFYQLLSSSSSSLCFSDLRD